MKKLIIMRHGEAESYARGTQDKDRELTRNGTREVLMKGHWMNENKLKPNLLIVSDAVRTMQTARLIMERCEIDDSNIQYTDRFYNALLGKIMEVVNEIPNEVNTAMLVAHNPGVSYLLEYLVEDTIPFIPSGIAVIEFQTNDWMEVSKGLGELVYLNNDPED